MVDFYRENPTYTPMQKLLLSRLYTIAELAVIAFVIPMVAMGHTQRGMIFAILWGMAIYCIPLYRNLKPGIRFKEIWDGAALREWSLWKPILIRFVISAIAMTGLVFAIAPERFLEFPTQRTPLWMMVMVFYPLLSVIPQEIIFRVFFFERYKAIFHGKWAMLAASAVTFGFAHVVLQNWVAVLMTIIGGYYFAQTYHKRQSLALVWAEHALYGCFLFTIGLGFYFYSGAPHRW